MIKRPTHEEAVKHLEALEIRANYLRLEVSLHRSSNSTAELETRRQLIATNRLLHQLHALQRREQRR